ncbi:MFS transporter [Geminisphaera colitermitum]|uniref:MFS transporter n=1 Tax=Geminisphaera colitermitum TaxID=1148786 RepID=UPI000158D5C5|nr:MFS transporter [Geminisphaera colitermitum]
MSEKLFHKVRPTAPEDKIPIPKRIAFGMGNFTDHIGTDTLMGNINPIFNIILHVDPRLIGLAIGIMRLWDAITDPVVGAISDNARTRWGRRRPFMFVGAILAGLTFPLIWCVPGGFSSFGIFLWLTVTAIAFYAGQTLFTVPWNALGYELTPDYNERTRLMEMRAYTAKLVVLIVPWAFAFTQLPLWGGDTMIGARWMGVGVGIIIIISGLIPVVFLTERFFKKAKDQEKVAILRSISLTLKNRPFLMMVVITFFSTLGGRLVNVLGFYIGLYYLFGGDKMKQGILAGVGGNVSFFYGLFCVWFLNRLSFRIGKRRTLGVCLVLLVLSGFAKWLFYIPSHPYASLAVMFFTIPSVTGFWLLISSIKADICDYDELQTGLRREGAIGAVSAWISKLSMSATAMLSGFILAYTGYKAEAGAEQASGVVDAMRWWFYIVPSVSGLIALIFLWWFPITETRAREIRTELEARRGKL